MASGDMNPEFLISAAGIKFNALVSGRGEDAVFVHGFGGDLHSWDSLVDALGNSPDSCARRMLRYDLRGFGKSFCDSEQRFSHSEDLLAIADAQGLQQFDLIGLSMGGAAALNFALNYPSRVRKLVLISPGMVAWEWSDDWLSRWQAIVEKARSGLMDEARLLWWQHPLFTTTRASSAGATLHDSILAYSGQQWVRDFQQRALPDIERLHSLAVPTLLLSGGQDMPDFLTIADVLSASVPELKRVHFANAGHLLQLECPAACAIEIARFL